MGFQFEKYIFQLEILKTVGIFKLENFHISTLEVKQISDLEKYNFL